MDTYLARPIKGASLYLWIDATNRKTREAGRIVSMSVRLALGVNCDGRREGVGIATGASEAEPFWTTFLRRLAYRGLRGVKLVMVDDHKEPRRLLPDSLMPDARTVGFLDPRRHGALCP